MKLKKQKLSYYTFIGKQTYRIIKLFKIRNINRVHKTLDNIKRQFNTKLNKFKYI